MSNHEDKFNIEGKHGKLSPSGEFKKELAEVELLSERATTHGSFETNASIAQELKAAMRASPRWEDLSDVRKESLEFIASKIGRILSGRSDLADHWADIAGYAELAKK